MEIERDGETAATIKKALVTPLRDRFSSSWPTERVEREGQYPRSRVQDRARRGHGGRVSKRWFRIRETYGIEVAPGQDDALVLALAACIDEMQER